MLRQYLDRKILVVEDERFMRTLLVQALHSLGFTHVKDAEDAEDALSTIEHWDVDLILTDIEMGEISGFDLIRSIREGCTPLANDTRIIVVSGLSELAALQHATELDVQGFLTKPTSQKMLGDKIVAAFKRTVNLRIYTQEPSAGADANTAKEAGERPDAQETKGGEDPKTKGRHAALAAEGVAQARVVSGMANTDAPATREGGEVGLYPLVDDAPASYTLPPGALQEGMLLARDVTAKGALLIKSGTRLGAMHLRVLRDLSGLLDFREVAVWRDPA